MRSGPGAARTILRFHFISARPSKQPRMVRTFLKVYMELGSYFWFLQQQIKDIIIYLPAQWSPSLVSRVTRTRTGGKRREGRGLITCNRLIPVRPCNGVTLSPPARTDCWGCALRHGAETVRPQGGEALFPCYSTNAARSLLTTVACHTAARSVEVNMPTNDRVGRTPNPSAVH